MDTFNPRTPQGSGFFRELTSNAQSHIDELQCCCTPEGFVKMSNMTLESSMIDHPSGLHECAPWHMPKAKCLEASSLDDPKQMECAKSPSLFHSSRWTTEKLTPYSRGQTNDATSLLFK
eukprot:3347817-Amphidinium_carterae.1